MYTCDIHVVARSYIYPIVYIYYVPMYSSATVRTHGRFCHFGAISRPETPTRPRFSCLLARFFAIVNVITGVFVTTAMETTSADKDLQVMKQLQKHTAQVEELPFECFKGLFSSVSYA